LGWKKYLPPNSLHWNRKEFAVQTEYVWIFIHDLLLNLFKLNTYGYFETEKREYSLTVATGGETKHSYNCKVILTNYIQAPYGLFGYLH